MTLSDALAEIRARYASRLTPEELLMMERQVDDLQITGKLGDVITTGSKLPHFSLPDTLGKRTSSKTLLKRGSLVIFFYRGSWCPFCTAELEALVDAKPTMRSFGARIVAITPQRPEMVEAVRVVRKVTFPVLIDHLNHYAATLGLAYGFSEYLRSLYEDIFHADLSKVNAGGDWQLPLPARIVVDHGGVVRSVDASLDYRTRPPLEPMLDLLGQLARPKTDRRKQLLQTVAESKDLTKSDEQ